MACGAGLLVKKVKVNGKKIKRGHFNISISFCGRRRPLIGRCSVVVLGTRCGCGWYVTTCSYFFGSPSADKMITGGRGCYSEPLGELVRRREARSPTVE